MAEWVLENEPGRNERQGQGAPFTWLTWTLKREVDEFATLHFAHREAGGVTLTYAVAVLVEGNGAGEPREQSRVADGGAEGLRLHAVVVPSSDALE